MPCSRCSKKGHNRRTCMQPTKDVLSSQFPIVLCDLIVDYLPKVVHPNHAANQRRYDANLKKALDHYLKYGF